MIFTSENGRVVKQVRETWKEWIWVEVSEGAYLPPPFYLPVHRIIYKRAMIYAIFPLAIPSVLLFIILGMLRSIWRDLMDVLDMLQNHHAKIQDTRRVDEPRRE